MIDKFTIKELLQVIIWLDILVVVGLGYLAVMARNAEKDRRILYQMIKKISGDLPN